MEPGDAQRSGATQAHAGPLVRPAIASRKERETRQPTKPRPTTGPCVASTGKAASMLRWAIPLRGSQPAQHSLREVPWGRRFHSGMVWVSLLPRCYRRSYNGPACAGGFSPLRQPPHAPTLTQRSVLAAPSMLSTSRHYRNGRPAAQPTRACRCPRVTAVMRWGRNDGKAITEPRGAISVRVRMRLSWPGRPRSNWSCPPS